MPCTHWYSISAPRVRIDHHTRGASQLFKFKHLEACRSRVNVSDEVATEMAIESLCHVTSAAETRTKIKLHTTRTPSMAATVMGAHSTSTQCSKLPQSCLKAPSQATESSVFGAITTCSFVSRDSFRSLKSWNHTFSHMTGDMSPLTRQVTYNNKFSSTNGQSSSQTAVPVVGTGTTLFSLWETGFGKKLFRFALSRIICVPCVQ